MTDSPDMDLLVAAAEKPRLRRQPETREERRARSVRSVWQQVPWAKIGLFGVSLFLFILAIALMKEGARSLAPFVRNQLSVTNPANSLGFGWLFAYIIMSGSPVAAAALTFFEAGAISKMSAFAMITGSRLGASFIVLLLGFIYVLRGRDRADSLGMGLLALIVTGTTFLVALVVGLGTLQSGILDQFQLQSGGVLNSVTNLLFDPIASLLMTFLPHWMLFPIGLGIIMISFNLFDKCLPQMAIKESQLGQMSKLVYRPWVMFMLGALITLVSMSVSVSLAILVPLSHRGFIRRENVIPYIMGANITTFIDTLLAAVLLNSAPAFTIVLAGMSSIMLVSIVILALFFHRYERIMLASVGWVTASNRNLGLFLMVIFAVPILLMLF